jgi:hypothetical protein
MTPQKVAENVQWMIKSCAFMYGGLDVEVTSFSYVGITLNIFTDRPKHLTRWRLSAILSSRICLFPSGSVSRVREYALLMLSSTSPIPLWPL